MNEFSNRLLGLINNYFPASFSARHLARIYSEEYGEVTTQKVAAALDALWYDGYLQKHVVRKGPKGNKNRYHIADMKTKIKSKMSKSKSGKLVSMDVPSR